MFFCENTEEYVFKYGDQASTYFIIGINFNFNNIVRGVCEVIIDDKIVRTLKQGDGFGELALLYGSPRTASIKC
jgi:cGMP-dependent protein kinase